VSEAPPRTRIGRYEIVREIGLGGGGRVYEARDPRLERTVAIKVLGALAPAEGVETEAYERFLREAKAAAGLQHPGIVTVYDNDVDAQTGEAYIVMEFVPGRSLHEILRESKRLPPDRAVAIGAQIARALQAAHEGGIVHRDVKPGNILVTDDGRAKITDFGVARLAASELTTIGRFVGTPNYASPEQVEGRPLDGRSDLFSLGAVLFRCLTGRLPFPGDSFSAIGFRIARGQMIDPRSVADDLPAAFHDFLKKALAVEPKERFSDGEEMARALVAAGGALGSGEPTPKTASLQRARPGRRSRIVWAAALVGAAAAAAALVFRGRPAPEPRLMPSHATVPAVPGHPPAVWEPSVQEIQVIERDPAQLSIALSSHLAEEVLVLRVDGEEALRKVVKVEGGLFKRIAGEVFHWTIPIAPGTHRIGVSVEGRSMKTRAEKAIRRTFAPGAEVAMTIKENPYSDTIEVSFADANGPGLASSGNRTKEAK
jgi:predicted Ser/Thr protein kinase